jgi:predicted ATPase
MLCAKPSAPRSTRQPGSGFLALCHDAPDGRPVQVRRTPSHTNLTMHLQGPAKLWLPPQRSAAPSPGYLMIRSAEIENFRGFKSLRLAGFRRINIVVGDNSSGKTALLEGLFLASGASPQVAGKLRAWRGYNTELEGPPDQLMDAIWRDLFFDLSYDNTASVRMVGTNGDTREMVITTASHDQHQEIMPLKRPQDVLAISHPLRFGWKGANDDDFHWETPEIVGQQIKVTVRESNVRAYFISSAHPVAPKFLATMLSDLRKEGKDAPFQQAMRKEFDYIKSISSEQNAGSAMLYAGLKGKTTLQPLNLMSSGIYKIANILLHMMRAKKGFVCVDEIENGIYYTRLKSLWSAVERLSNQNQSQVFATTHSLECLQAAAKVLPARELSLIQVFREKNGSCRALLAEGENAIAAIESGIEVRS